MGQENGKVPVTGMREDEMKKLNSNDPNTRSTDVVAANIEQLRALFPEMVTEGADGAVVNLDVLKVLVGDDTVSDSDEKYGLNWHGKRRARQLALTPSIGTLRPCSEDGLNWDTTQNLMIEGDNLEVLKLLQKSYAGKVKLIYIDPPYNTGKDFVYTDNFQDNIKNYLELTGQVEGGAKVSSNTEAGGRFHTVWLSMMYSRLKACRTLLTHKGLLFISVDDTEVHNLRLICNEVFGEESFVGCISRVTGTPTGGGNKALVGEIDYLLAFSRSASAAIEGVNLTDEDALIYSKEDSNGRYLTRTIRRTGGEDRREDRPSMFYPLTAPDGTHIYPMGPTGYESRWICGLKRFKEMDEEGLIEWVKTNKDGSEEWQVYQKFYLDGRNKQPSNFWSRLEGNKKATRDLRAMFDDKKVFTFPKPVGLIQHIIKLSGLSDNDIVLDFFAGSGTTAQAVMAQNATDGGSRRYILVQLPQPLDPGNKDQKVAAELCDKLGKPRNIAEITKERIRRAAKKVKNDNPKFAGDLGFRAFKLDSTNIHEWEADPSDLESSLLASVEHLKENRSEADVLYELLLKLGLDLCVPIETRSIAGKRVQAIGGGALITCLAKTIAREDVEPLAVGIVDWHKMLAPDGDTTCVFRDSAFADDVSKTNMAAILEQQGIANVRSL